MERLPKIALEVDVLEMVDEWERVRRERRRELADLAGEVRMLPPMGIFAGLTRKILWK